MEEGEIGWLVVGHRRKGGNGGPGLMKRERGYRSVLGGGVKGAWPGEGQ